MDLRITPKFNTTQLQQRNDQNNTSFCGYLDFLGVGSSKAFDSDTVNFLEKEAKKYCGKFDPFTIFTDNRLNIRYRPNSFITKGMQETSRVINTSDDVIKFMQDQHAEYIKYNA